MEKVILAYSGGLDTSIILHWLSYEKSYDVVALCVDVGQKENFGELKKKAKDAGASKVFIVDKKKELAELSIKAVKSHAVYEGSYFLGTALARIPMVEAQVEFAEKENATYVAHGATAKGNDQIRFELGYHALNKSLKVISPWKSSEFLKQFKSREDLINYAEKNNIKLNTSNKTYSIDENLLHTSYEGGPLKDAESSTSSFLDNITELPAKIVELDFYDNFSLKEEKENHTSVKAFEKIKELSEEYLFGINDIIENRFIGLKSRGVYKQGVMYMLSKAYDYIESASLEKELYHKKLSLGLEIGKLIYEGKWFTKHTQSLVNFSVQNSVQGTAGMLVVPYNVFNIYSKFNGSGILKKSDFDMNNFNVENSAGFIEILKIGS